MAIVASSPAPSLRSKKSFTQLFRSQSDGYNIPPVPVLPAHPAYSHPAILHHTDPSSQPLYSTPANLSSVPYPSHSAPSTFYVPEVKQAAPKSYQVQFGICAPAPVMNKKRRNSPSSSIARNRSLSLRSNKSDKSSGGILSGGSGMGSGGKKHTFSFGTLRGSYQPDLSKRLFRLIKSENHVISSYSSAARERVSIASQLSDWGEATGDDAVSEISDKLGVLLSELGEQDEQYAQNLEDYRCILKQIRNTEASVQPSRDNKNKITDEIAKLKYKDPTNTKLVQLEQELVRAEAENLVAEAQLTNVTRTKLKEAYAQHFAAVIERSEKQKIMAEQGRKMLALLDDTPVVPGDARPAFANDREAREILNETEERLRKWTLNLEDVELNHEEVEMPAQRQPHERMASGSSSTSGKFREQFTGEHSEYDQAASQKQLA